MNNPNLPNLRSEGDWQNVESLNQGTPSGNEALYRDSSKKARKQPLGKTIGVHTSVELIQKNCPSLQQPEF